GSIARLEGRGLRASALARFGKWDGGRPRVSGHFGARNAPRALLADPRHLPVDPQVDIDALEAPFAVAPLGEGIPRAHAEDAVLERFDVVLQDRPEALDAHGVGAFGRH